MVHLSILVSGADFIKNMNFGAREGSMFDDFVSEKKLIMIIVAGKHRAALSSA